MCSSKEKRDHILIVNFAVKDKHIQKLPDGRIQTVSVRLFSSHAILAARICMPDSATEVVWIFSRLLVYAALHDQL